MTKNYSWAVALGAAMLSTAAFAHAPRSPERPKLSKELQVETRDKGWLLFPVPKEVMDSLGSAGAKYSPVQLRDIAFSYMDACAPKFPKTPIDSADISKQLECIDGWATVLANVHQFKSSLQRTSGLVEKSMTIGGATGLLLGGASRGLVTSNVWSVIAIGPLVWAETYGTQPREQLQHGASLAVRRLSQHYAQTYARLGDLEASASANEGAFEMDRRCAFLAATSSAVLATAPATAAQLDQSKSDAQTLLQAATSAAAAAKTKKAKSNAQALLDKAHAAVARAADAPSLADAQKRLQADVKAASDYCQSFSAAETAFTPFLMGVKRSRAQLPTLYLEDAQNLESVFFKIDESFEASPSKALTNVVASALLTIADAIKNKTSMSSISDPEVTFDLEKDGLPLRAPLVAGLVAPTKTFPETILSVPAGLDGDIQKAAESRDLRNALSGVSDMSQHLKHENARLNASPALLADISATYRMTFDFRKSKTTADVEGAANAAPKPATGS